MALFDPLAWSAKRGDNAPDMREQHRETDSARVSWGALWREGMCCAARNLASRPGSKPFRDALRLALCPVDFWRYFEFGAALSVYRGESPVLDVGSPKLLARVWAQHFGAEVWATDIVPGVLEECGAYGRGLRRGAILGRVVDAAAMDFADESFPFVCSISVVEHIAGEGDSRALQEIARVLRPGGRAVVTVPYVPRYAESWRDRDPYGRQIRDAAGRVFFSRYYDRDAIQERLVLPSGLSLISLQAWQERRDGWYNAYIRRTACPLHPAAMITKALDPLWARTQVEPVPDASRGVSRHGLAALVFAKNR